MSSDKFCVFVNRKDGSQGYLAEDGSLSSFRNRAKSFVDLNDASLEIGKMGARNTTSVVRGETTAYAAFFME